MTRLGYDPFVDDSPVTLQATIARSGRGLIGELRIEDPTHPLAAARQIEAGPGECAELGKALALAMSIAIDPLRALDGAKTAPSGSPLDGGVTSSRASLPAATETPSQTNAQSQSNGLHAGADSRGVSPKGETPGSRLKDVSSDANADSDPEATAGGEISIVRGNPFHWQMAAGALVALGPEPDISGGVLAGIGLAGRALSLELEARGDLPRDASYGAGRVAVSTVLASFIVCGRLTTTSLCGVGGAGAMHGQGHGYAIEASGSSFLTMLGIRVSYEGVMTEPVRLRAMLDLDWVMTKNSFNVDGRSAWTVSPAAASIGVATVVRFR